VRQEFSSKCCRRESEKNTNFTQPRESRMWFLLQQTPAMQSSEPRSHFCLFRPLERSVCGSVSNMKRLPAADPPVLCASAKTARLARAEESSASIPLLAGVQDCRTDRCKNHDFRSLDMCIPEEHCSLLNNQKQKFGCAAGLRRPLHGASLPPSLIKWWTTHPGSLIYTLV